MAAFSSAMFSRVSFMAAISILLYSATSLTNSMRFSRSDILLALNSTER